MKPIVLALGNFDGYNYVTFKKSEKLFKVFDMWLNSYPDLDLDDLFYSEKELTGDGSVKRKVKDTVDKSFHFKGKGMNFNIIFGKDKVFVVGIFDKEPLFEIIEKECEFYKQ